jgi:hypothetical protein
MVLENPDSRRVFWQILQAVVECSKDLLRLCQLRSVHNADIRAFWVVQGRFKFQSFLNAFGLSGSFVAMI